MENAETLAARIRRKLETGTPYRQVAQELLQGLQAQPLSAYLSLARGLTETGPRELALDLLQDALRRWPQDLDLYYTYGNALRLCGRFDQAESVLRHVIGHKPNHEKAALSLAHMLREIGRPGAAGRVVSELHGALPPSIERSLGYLEFLIECREYRQAHTLCSALLAGGNQDARLHLTAGRICHVLGDFAAARPHLVAAMDGGLDMEAWGGIVMFLASAQRYDSLQHPDVARFQAMAAKSTCSSGVRAAASFALAKVHDDVNDFAGAARLYRDANQLAAIESKWSAEAWRQFVERQVRMPPLPPVTASWRDASPAPIPVFVVGLPRSGTSLVADRLGRHPQVRNRGELNWMQFIAQNLGNAELQRPEALRAAAELYLRQLRLDDAPARWYIDKNPLNFRYLDLIAAMFPQARIIHCTRDRRDNALSLWCQFFAHQDCNFAYSLPGIAAFAQGADRLMQHWHQRPGLPTYGMDYARLVEQPAAMFKELTDFLGLPPFDLLGAAPKADSAVATASVWQVRQAIYTSSRERWRVYAPHVPELIDLFPM